MPHFKGEGGVIWRMDKPLHSTILDQIKNGVLEEVEYERPAPTADRSEWIEYLVVAHDYNEADIAAMSRPDLIKLVKELEA